MVISHGNFISKKCDKNSTNCAAFNKICIDTRHNFVEFYEIPYAFLIKMKPATNTITRMLSIYSIANIQVFKAGLMCSNTINQMVNVFLVYSK